MSSPWSWRQQRAVGALVMSALVCGCAAGEALNGADSGRKHVGSDDSGVSGDDGALADGGASTTTPTDATSSDDSSTTAPGDDSATTTSPGDDSSIPTTTTTPVTDSGATTTPATDSAAATDTSVSTPDVPTGSCASPFSGALATYDFSSEPGNESSVAAASAASGVTAGSLTRGPGLAAVTGSSSINASGWSTSSSADKRTYYTLTLTPPAGCAIDLSKVSLTEKSSGTGPSAGEVGSSIDGFSSLAGFPSDATFDAPVSASGTAGAAVEIRIYGHGATSSGGTMRLTSTLTVSGSLR